ncbi:Hsp20/alpha crystallin family protein [Cytobacillus purgationiresistens]|uniref:Spore coat protein M/HSP20 family protein n=1 Tax=Cytobacillus purgationiresistens TaxID=863449 RepID=A0ABU0AFW5_9BACI|nr:Hsp20/alpha crystallin family protein [Cytobacillus purgationiresistens]MDQ0269616.1 spore coat protein M/HSP20 family protein [Cytobacillus purgationiresistens]
MNKEDDKESFNLTDVEKWMENFFLDPLTSYIDQVTFRIDLFETDNDIIIEALLTDFDPSTIKVHIENENVIINANKQSTDDPPIKRSIELPFKVADKAAYAKLNNNILEIYISKQLTGSGKCRQLPIQ